MKTSELKSKLTEMGLTVKDLKGQVDPWLYAFNSSGRRLAGVALKESGVIRTYSGILDYSVADKNRLISIMLDYAQTPIKDRGDEKRCNIIIGQDIGRGSITAWYKTYDGFRMDDLTAPEDLKSTKYRFTDGEFKELCRRLTSVPYGPDYVRIAEIGKREVIDEL